MARTTKTDKAPKAGTKGSAARKRNTTPLGNTRAIDDNSFAAPKRKPREKAVSLAEALAESGETMEELKAPAADEAPVRPAGTSNLANTIRARRKSYTVMLAPNGKKTQNTGDEVATLLLHVKLDVLKQYCAGRFGKSYDTLNPGHQRMCFGNLIRAAAKTDPAVMEWLVAQQPKVEEAP